MFPNPNQARDSINIHNAIREEKDLFYFTNSLFNDMKESFNKLSSTYRKCTHRIDVSQQGSNLEQALQDARQIVQCTSNLIQNKRQKLDVNIAEADLPFHLRGYAQGKVRNSIIRISTKSGFSTAAIILASTRKQLFVLTSLRIWSQNEFVKLLSKAFRKEMRQMTRSVRDHESEIIPENQDPSLHSKKTASNIQVSSDVAEGELEFVAEAVDFFPHLETVVEFNLSPSMCWQCSAEFDFAIFQLNTTVFHDLKLCVPQSSYNIAVNDNIFILGLSSSAKEKDQENTVWILPALVTERHNPNVRLAVNEPLDLSGTAFLCTADGVIVGYICNVSQMSSHDRTQVYGYDLTSIPRNLMISNIRSRYRVRASRRYRS